MKKIYLLILVFVSVWGCNQSKETSSNSESEIKNKRWVLQSMKGYDIYDTKMRKETFLSLNNTNDIFMGEASCNSYSGSYKIDGNRLYFKDIIATRMACDQLDIEQTYFENLRNTNKYKIRGDELYLYNNNNEELIKFKVVWLK